MAHSPLVRFPGRGIILPPRYLGPIEWYALASAFEWAAADTSMRFDKRNKTVHRTVIASTHGPMTLTVPIAKPDHSTALTWNYVKISPHGNWWDNHLTALESAYGRTPFFEFYIDRFLPYFQPLDTAAPLAITDLDSGLDHEIRLILGIPPQPSEFDRQTGIDLTTAPLPTMPQVPYYQIRAKRLGFIPSMSILDLIFNIGPEAPLILRQMTETLYHDFTPGRKNTVNQIIE